MSDPIQRRDDATPLNRLLGLFTRVEPGEASTALLLTLDLFLVLTAYYILKTVREPLILMGGGAEVKSYAAAGQALLLIGVVPLYSVLVDRMDRVRLIRNVTLFFMSNLILFYVLARLEVPYLGVAFYLWVGIFSLMIIAQVWSFANDLYTEGQGKRLFPLVAFGSSMGAVAGSAAAGALFDLGLGAFEMMLVSTTLLGATLVIHAVVCRRERGALARRDEAEASVAADDDGGVEDRRSGFTIVLQDRYLLLIGLLLLLTNIVNTNGEYILSARVEAWAEGAGADIEASIGGFYSAFFTAVNALGAALQLFAVSRILRWIGVRGALFVLPLIALGGYAAIAMGSALGVIRIAKILENSTDYSLQNTTRQALFLPTSRAAKYKAKQAIDTFFVRMGDVASAGLVFMGVTLGFAVRHFAMMNLGFVAVWLVFALLIGRRYRRLVEVEA